MNFSEHSKGLRYQLRILFSKSLLILPNKDYHLHW